jgi:quercetin dioxygenase-like cupin family protein
MTRTIWRRLRITRFAACLFLGVLCGAAWQARSESEQAKAKYEPATAGVRLLERAGGPTIKLLVDAASLGGSEVEVGQITFPAGYKPSLPHQHHNVEIFYVVSGKLGHTVNGQKHVITPGTVGIVRPGDTVVHSVESDEPVEGLVIWAPGGEADLLIKRGVFKSTPIGK